MDAQSAFAEILENLPRQHLRTRFRNRFGTEESDFDVSTFARGTVRAELSKRLGHLMQEEPEKLSATLLTGTADSLKVENIDPSAADPIESLLQGDGDRLLVVHGLTARLYAYLGPGSEEAWVRRVGLEKSERPNAKPPAPVLSRRQRAAAAGKRKVVKNSPQRRRR
jgi:hypothetical protein